MYDFNKCQKHSFSGTLFPVLAKRDCFKGVKIVETREKKQKFDIFPFFLFF